jgi:hypothetical protein
MRTHIASAMAIGLLALISLPTDARTLDTRTGELPANISIAADLRDLVSHMLRVSPTFRGQCAMLRAAPHFRIRIALEERPGDIRNARAQSELARYELGAVNAVVRLWSRDDAAELIAHELEHVIEVAEGLDLRALSLLTPAKVWTTATGAIETSRAIEIGRRVKQESLPQLSR